MQERQIMPNLFLKMCLVFIVLIVFAVPCVAEIFEAGIFQVTGNVTVAKDKVIEGDVVALAGNITIYGTVNGGVTTMSGNITIYGRVKGNVNSTSGNIYVRGTGEVIGNVTAVSGKVFQDASTMIAGSITQKRNQPTGMRQAKWKDLRDIWHTEFYISPKIPWYILIWSIVTGLISSLAFAALMMLFFAQPVQTLAQIIEKRPGYYFLVGLLGYVLTPLIFFLAIASIVGIAFVFIMFFALIFATALGQLGLAKIIGQRLVEKFHWTYKNEMILALIGTLAIYLISIIPIIGWLFFIITACIGFGSTINFLKMKKKGGPENVA